VTGSQAHTTISTITMGASVAMAGSAVGAAADAAQPNAFVWFGTSDRAVPSVAGVHRLEKRATALLPELLVHSTPRRGGCLGVGVGLRSDCFQGIGGAGLAAAAAGTAVFIAGIARLRHQDGHFWPGPSPHRRSRIAMGPMIDGSTVTHKKGFRKNRLGQVSQVFVPNKDLIVKRRGNAFGVVSAWDPEEGRGTIKYEGREEHEIVQKEIRFRRGNVPQAWLKKHDGMIPASQKVEFEIMQSGPNSFYADNLCFPVKSFFELGLTEEVIRGASLALGLDPAENMDAPKLIRPAPVQAQAIPMILEGKEVVIAAETGSGKSLAYMLPLAQLVRNKVKAESLDFGWDRLTAAPTGIILCPTRELAMQAHSVFKRICSKAGITSRAIYGGSLTWKKQCREVNQLFDVLICTPDRLLRMINERILNIKLVEHICIDEADFLLTQGFEDVYEVLNKITEFSRKPENIRYTLISATITAPMYSLLEKDDRWKNMQLLESRSLHKPQSSCHHAMIETKGRDKIDMLVSMIRPEIRSIFHQLRDTFVRNKDNRFIGCLHKELESTERAEVLRKFVRGEYKVLICTDIAQRGLDLPTVGHVINFDFPMNSVDYIHRGGRTARFGEEGKVSSLVTKTDRYLAKGIERAVQLGKPINDLSSDKRDYLPGGSLYHLITRQTAAGRAQLRPRNQYAGSLR